MKLTNKPKKKVSKVNIQECLLLQKDAHFIRFLITQISLSIVTFTHIKRYKHICGKVLMRNLPVGTDKAMVPLPLV